MLKSILLVCGSLMWLTVVADNNNPVVLIHGLAGTGENFAYRDELEDAGLPTFIVEVGKFTSNWDRACETYAQIKGTRVDYGVCHSREFGHERFGPDFTGKGLYPQWDENHKIHVIGHSMGGQTMRTLERLLREGSGCTEDTHPLLAGGKNWVTSFTGLSAPYDGTAFVDLLGDDLLDVIKTVITGFAGLIDNTLIDELYTIDFSQWGIEREPGESFDSFWDRVVASGFLSVDNKDISVYDLSPAGARENNAKGELAYDDTYYFSFATERTSPKQDCFFFICGDEYEAPDSGMSFFLKITGKIIGKQAPRAEQKNDGLVPWISSLCPTKQDSDRDNCVEFDGAWSIGTWHYVDVPYLDHLQIVGRDGFNDLFNYGRSAKKLYVEHAERLRALP